MNERHDVIVVGAGLAGLTAARYCARAGLDVLVLDPHPGGRARTDERNGVQLNRGPHALYRGGSAERVLADLGVRYTGHTPLTSLGRGVFAGELYGLPSSAASLLNNKFLGVRAKAAFAKLMATLPKLKPADFADVTVDDWTRDLPERARTVVLALARLVTYANAPHIASAEVPIAALQAPNVLYLDGGWQTMVDQLLVGVNVRHESAIAVTSGSVSTPVGTYEADHVVVGVATPNAAANLLANKSTNLGFGDAPIVEAACLDLALSAPPKVGFLLGLDQPHYFSQHNPPARLADRDDRWVVHVARYLAPDDALSPSDQRAELEQHAALAGVEEHTVVEARYLHRMTVTGAVVTAANGGLAGRPPVSVRGHDGVYLAGDWVGAHGQLADASFASGAEAARLICAAPGRAGG